MEKLGLLINNLNELYNNGASEDKLVALSLEILSELTTPHNRTSGSDKVSVIMPSFYVAEHNEVPAPIEEPIQEETITINQVEENASVAEVEELVVETPVVTEEIKKHDTDPYHINEIIQKMNEAPILPFETLIKPVSNNEVLTNDVKEFFELKDSFVSAEETLNDKLKEEHEELNHNIKQEPVKDIKRALNINEKYVFINELFRGDDAMFERSLKTINSFTIYPEAQYWIQRELKVKLGWNESSTTVQHFDSLVKRRFAS